MLVITNSPEWVNTGRSPWLSFQNLLDRQLRAKAAGRVFHFKEKADALKFLPLNILCLDQCTTFSASTAVISVYSPKK